MMHHIQNNLKNFVSFNLIWPDPFIIFLCRKMVESNDYLAISQVNIVLVYKYLQL